MRPCALESCGSDLRDMQCLADRHGVSIFIWGSLLAAGGPHSRPALRPLCFCCARCASQWQTRQLGGSGTRLMAGMSGDGRDDRDVQNMFRTCVLPEEIELVRGSHVTHLLPHVTPLERRRLPHIIPPGATARGWCAQTVLCSFGCKGRTQASLNPRLAVLC